jgi:hypothetical protein
LSKSNCYYKTSAVHKNLVEAKDNGNSIWKIKLKLGTDPNDNILKEKDKLMSIIRNEGYRLKDIEISTV